MRCFRSTSLAAALIVAAIMLAPRALAQPGALDPTFGDGGVVLIDSSNVRSVTLDSDGRIVVAGINHAYTNFGTTVWRFDPDGTADLTFGTAGFTTVEEYGLFCGLRGCGIAVLPSDDLVAAGSWQVEFEYVTGRGWLLTQDGTLERVIGVSPEISDIMVRPEGRFVIVGGPDLFNEPPYCGIWQYLPDGTPDPAFGDNGFVNVMNESTCTATLVSDGRLVIILSNSEGRRAARLLQDGSLDPTFGDGGMVPLSPLNNGVSFSAFAYSDGTLLFGGRNINDGVPTLVRYDEDGTLDASFGEGGVATFEGMGVGTGGANLAVQSGDSIVFAVYPVDSPINSVARVFSDGTLDPSFGEAGIVSLDLGFNVSRPRLILDGEERIVLAGSSRNETDPTGFVVRLLNAGAVASEPSAKPEQLALSAPAPNPASGPIALAYTLSEPVPVRLAVYDVLGREVAVLAEGTQAAGQHEVALDTRHLTPGLYVVRLTAGDDTVTRRLTIVR